MKYIALCALIALALSYAPAAEQSRRDLMVYGIGTQSCGKWLRARDEATTTIASGPRLAFTSWVHGFLTGAIATGRELRDTDNAGIQAWMDKFCTENPVASVDEASAHLAHELTVQP